MYIYSEIMAMNITRLVCVSYLWLNTEVDVCSNKQPNALNI